MGIDTVEKNLRENPKTWLLTGVAGFIGSNILERLLNLGQKVIGLDNFATGFQKNLTEVEKIVGPEKWKLFQFQEGSIEDYELCSRLMANADIILHQAALGSVPRSINDPITSNKINTDGTLNIFEAARRNGCKRVVYASSSSVYGDHPDLPKFEEKTGNPLSPYAVTKKTNELYAAVFSSQFNMTMVGLRYFNVFGPRQSPEGPYAAVIPLWFKALLKDEDVKIFGDGKTSRDFTFVQNIVDLNILAGVQDLKQGHYVFNGACGANISLNELFGEIKKLAVGDAADKKPIYKDFRAGDIRHSHADIKKAKEILGYKVKFEFAPGLELATSWYKEHLL